MKGWAESFGDGLKSGDLSLVLIPKPNQPESNHSSWPHPETRLHLHIPDWSASAFWIGTLFTVRQCGSRGHMFMSRFFRHQPAADLRNVSLRGIGAVFGGRACYSD